MLLYMRASLLFVQTKKVVQTEVDPSTYTRLKHLADRRSVPLKALLRDALRSYVDVEEGRLEEDPIFRIVGSLKLAGRAWSERKDWRPEVLAYVDTSALIALAVSADRNHARA